MACAAAIFYLEVEAALRTQFLNGGRIQHEDARVAIAGEMLVGARDDGRHAVARTAQAPVLERHERDGVVLPWPLKLKPLMAMTCLTPGSSFSTYCSTASTVFSVREAGVPAGALIDTMK